MQTRLLRSNQLSQAAEIIRAGGLVVFPTETVYGLGANAFDAAACGRIFAAKQRPAANPLIVHVCGDEMLRAVVAQLPPRAEKLLAAFTPGPLTLVLPARAAVAATAIAGQSTVAVRQPAHPIARRLIAACGVPLAAPSANRSGRPSPTDCAMAQREMQGRVDAIIDGGACHHGLESTIVGVEDDRLLLLREGVITREMLAEIAEVVDPPRHPTQLLRVTESVLQPAAAVPGSVYAHYRPNVPVIAAERVRLAALLRRYRGRRPGLVCLGSAGAAGRYAIVTRIAADTEQYGRELYRFFCECEQLQCGIIIAELPTGGGLGRALRDRLLRAAARN